MVVPLPVSDETQSELNSIELAGVEAIKPPTAARIDPPIEVAMKDLVEKYRPVRQRTVRSETTKDKSGGALPPAVYYAQHPHSKVMFHDDSTGEGQEGMEQIMPQVTDDDGGLARAQHHSRVKRIDCGYELSQFLSGRGGGADTVVDVATVEFRFGAVVLAEKLVFDKTYKKIGMARSHFGTHGYTIGLFEKVVPE
ncbi:hypothetical protein AWC38_SpisGene24125 [Stylophora pistillata]|uniref:Uncharacterized protein n=1 Tax=Stylophora pistillata TaxID=50429 RepID=A0A2B4R593_STYPI|nr:hypothetical protein AWC38_SpisGene24125 [Stylophora pistillata]